MPQKQHHDQTTTPERMATLPKKEGKDINPALNRILMVKIQAKASSQTFIGACTTLGGRALKGATPEQAKQDTENG